MNSYGQELIITHIDSSQFPEIKLTLTYNGKAKFNQADLKLSQGGNAIPYTLSAKASGSESPKDKGLFLLIEASGITNGKTLRDFKEASASSLDNIDSQYFVDFGWFGSAEADSLHGKLNLNSTGFSNKHDKLKADILNAIKSLPDTGNRVDLFGNILEALNFIGAQTNLPKDIRFIVLSTGKNKSKISISQTDCVNKAAELGIKIYAITYPPSDTALSSGKMMNRMCERTGGKEIYARTQLEIINALSEFYSIPSPAYLQENTYELLFTAQPENGVNRAMLELNFKGGRELFSVSDGKSESLFPEDYKLYLWISIGILGLVVMIMILVNVFSGRGKVKQNEEEIEQAAQGLKKPTAEKPEKPIEDKTTLKPVSKISPTPASNSNNTPVVLVNMDGRTQSYHIDKPEITIGRHDTNDIIIKDPTVTGKHAILSVQGQEITLIDLGSTNGTFVNGERIRKKIIAHGDKIRLGNTELTIKN